jgi:hypothetical protein
MGGGRIIPRSLKTRGNKNYFQPRPKFCYLFKSYMTPLFLLKIVFPKFDPLTVTGMALCAVQQIYVFKVKQSKNYLFQYF